MLLFLAGVRTESIMMLGRWHSDTFMLYIQRQVKELADGISQDMMQIPAMFHNIPQTTNNNNPITTSMNTTTNPTSQHIPYIPRSTLTSRGFNGPVSKGTPRRDQVKTLNNTKLSKRSKAQQRVKYQQWRGNQV
jgi:hypothetical protein